MTTLLSILVALGALVSFILFVRGSRRRLYAHEQYGPSVLMDIDAGVCPRCETTRQQAKTTSDGFWTTFHCTSCGYLLKAHVCKQVDAA